jgi:hypothetical protein
MKKILIITFSALLLSIFVLNPVLADETTTTLETTSSSVETTTTLNTQLPVKQIKPLIKGIDSEDLKQFLSIQEKDGWRLGQIETDEKTNTIISLKAAEVTGINEVQDINEDNIEVSIFGIDYVIKLGKAKLYRQMWGEADINEISCGDIVNVYGYLENDNKTINAINVRDLSIIPLETVIKGTITAITNSNIILQTDDNNQITVLVDENTRIIKFVGANTQERYEEGELSDLKPNDLVIIRGIYNTNGNNMKATVIITGNDNRPYFKLNKASNGLGIKNQIQEIKNLINQIKEQFRIKFR